MIFYEILGYILLVAFVTLVVAIAVRTNHRYDSPKYTYDDTLKVRKME